MFLPFECVQRDLSTSIGHTKISERSMYKALRPAGGSSPTATLAQEWKTQQKLCEADRGSRLMAPAQTSDFDNAKSPAAMLQENSLDATHSPTVEHRRCTVVWFC